MKKNQTLIMAAVVAALVGLAVLMHHGRQADSAAPPVAQITRHAAQADIAGIAPAARSGENIPQPGGRFMALIAEIRPKVDAALLASDFKMADRYVDEALTTPGLEPIEKQRLMVVKMGARGMRGDHAAMLTLMDEIIAMAPDSPLAAELGKERPQLEKIQRLGPNHRELCLTCGQMHAPGTHAPTKKSQE